MGQYLALVSIGPVQEFIASARRSRDLWFGSWVLSELSKTVARAIVGAQPLDALVFPAPVKASDLDPGSATNVANKIIARISVPPDEMERSVRCALRQRLHALRDEAFKNVGAFKRGEAEQQVDDLVELIWVAVPLAGAGDYSRARAKLEALMAARKVTRDFPPITISWGASLPKSSLDGQRESVIPEDAYPQRGEAMVERHRKARELYRQYGAGPAERLSGVDLLKRHGNRAGASNFPSTSHIAAVPLLERLRTEPYGPKHGAWKEYWGTLARLGAEIESALTAMSHPVLGPYDGSLLFESRLVDLFAAESPDEASLDAARKALRTFLGAATGGREPLPYYALLHADGDHMGKVIDAQQTDDKHRELSRALADFAGGVDGIIAKHRGATIYSGGDDVLALVPVHTVVRCARELAGTFATHLRRYEVNDAEGVISPTLSVGVALSHHLEPLSDALELARAAERRAKATPGKNALAVTVSKRSGADRTIAGTWGRLDRALERWTDLHVREAIPDGLAYELRDLASLAGHSQPSSLSELMKREAVRILRRKQAERGARLIDAETVQAITDAITGEESSLANLADELIAARTFADAHLQTREQGAVSQ